MRVGFSVTLYGMATDYNTIRYMESIGGSLRVHYKDGQKVDSYPDGRGRFIPRKGPIPPPPPPPPPPEEEPPPPPPPITGNWTHPLPGATLTSPYGPRSFDFHYGDDLSTTTGDAGGMLLAVTDLHITVAHDMDGNQTAGVYVKGHTFDGLYTFTYAHGVPGSLLVSPGQDVSAGQELFREGHSGNAYGTHCHFECYDGVQFDPWAPPWGNPRDPEPVLNEHGIYLR